MAKRTESVWCCKCREVTTWTGGERRVYCAGCGTDFPCARDCTHWDCLEQKQLAAADHNGVLRLVLARPVPSAAGTPDSAHSPPAESPDAGVSAAAEPLITAATDENG
jgi:hypothetical protein